MVGDSTAVRAGSVANFLGDQLSSRHPLAQIYLLHLALIGDRSFTSSAATNPPFPIGLRVLKHARLERPASMRFLYVASQVLARRSPATILCRLTDHLRRLTSHGPVTFRSCPRLASVSYELFIWYYDSCKKIGTKHRGLRTLVDFRTHKLTPMLGVLAPKHPTVRF